MIAAKIGKPYAAAQRYWDASPDPLNRGRGHRRSGAARRMQLAYDTYLSPETMRGVAWLGDLADRRVVVLGSGLGVGALHLAQRGAEVIGTDLSATRCAAAEAWAQSREVVGSLQFRVMSAEALQLDVHSVDAVFARDVLMYTSPARVAAECARILHPGGRAVFVESLRGGRTVRTLRRLVSPAPWRPFTRHLDLASLGALGNGLCLEQIEGWHLFGMAAFFMLFALGWEGGYRGLQRGALPLDRYLLSRYPTLQNQAWRGVARYRVEEGPPHV
ncbi:MAG: class I SAM-dependent methyltransferase [Verrucomicrobia bacterium]|jgi:SAM-dependent methyltransferase|nr:class I SAM-dependent methyltransferase [Verrucomicrobiota bacterium]MBT7067505.1 class I SAM-dependent methyltransferase [Verrucomicrobiota bacterium]MBT7698690.1 class I SAM-dependent methyltransferase [Verrucomicrobiota bacterium]